jgi:sodium/hydrogen exchanger 8
MAYFSYTINEMIEYSGVLSIYVCSMVMKHYTIFNMSPKAKSGLKTTIKFMAYICEGSLFLYMGYNSWSTG